MDAGNTGVVASDDDDDEEDEDVDDDTDDDDDDNEGVWRTAQCSFDELAEISMC